MATRKTTIFILAVILALCIGFVVGITVDYPKPDESTLAGTVGKVNKYRKTRMTARDIQLRSELTRDTARLKNIIREMVHFSLLTEEMGKTINLSLVACQARGMGTLAGEENQMELLRDYSDFIRNNNHTLNATISMLTGICTGDTADLSYDIEKNLRDFGAYVRNLSEKNQVLNQAVLLMDNFMLNNEVLKTHKSDIAQLKSIRDQLVIKAVELIGLSGTGEQLGRIIESAITAEEKLGVVLGTEKLQYALASEKLAIDAKEKINVAETTDLGYILSTGNIALVFAAGTNQIGLLDKTGLQITAAYEKLQVIAIFGQGTVNVAASNYSLQSLTNSELYTQAFTGADISQIFTIGNIESIFSNSSGFTAAIAFIASQDLGDN